MENNKFRRSSHPLNLNYLVTMALLWDEQESHGHASGQDLDILISAPALGFG